MLDVTRAGPVILVVPILCFKPLDGTERIGCVPNCVEPCGSRRLLIIRETRRLRPSHCK